jgi:hypothetical protein
MTLQYTLVGTDEGSNITVFVQGQPPLVAHSTHPNFEKIVAGTMANDEKVVELFDIAQTVGQKFRQLTARVTAENGRLYFDGEEVDGAVADQVLRFLTEGVDDWKPLVALFENLQDNPSEHSRKQLYNWIKAAKLTITKNGMIVGYKGVSSSGNGKFHSIHSGGAIVDGEEVGGNVPNQPGSIIEMAREKVTFDPSVACSVGLHVGTWDYASGFGRYVLEVHVNPRDVVSVPDDHHGQKMRVCRYTVIGETTKAHEKPVVDTKPPAQPKPESKKSETKVNTNDTYGVKVGDVYEDNDSRRKGRKITVKSIDGSEAIVTSKSLLGERSRKIALTRLTSYRYSKVS